MQKGYPGSQGKTDRFRLLAFSLEIAPHIFVICMGLIVFTLLTTRPAIFPIAAAHRILSSLIVVSFTYGFTKLIIITVRWKTIRRPIIMQFIKVILAFSFVLVASRYLFLKADYIEVTRQQIRNSPEIMASLIKLTNVIYNVTIDCEGNAKVLRKQYLVPQKDINTIPEVGYFSSGGFSKDDFRIKIYEIDAEGNFIDIDSEISLFEESSERLIHTLIEDNYLKKGKSYLRQTEIKAEGSYIDTTTDAFIVLVEYPTSAATINIEFKGGCSYDSNTLRIEAWKLEGIPLKDPLPLAPKINTGKTISVSKEDLKVGDEYGIIWEYDKPPAVPSD